MISDILRSTQLVDMFFSIAGTFSCYGLFYMLYPIRTSIPPYSVVRNHRTVPVSSTAVFDLVERHWDPFI